MVHAGADVAGRLIFDRDVFGGTWMAIGA